MAGRNFISVIWRMGLPSLLAVAVGRCALAPRGMSAADCSSVTGGNVCTDSSCKADASSPCSSISNNCATGSIQVNFNEVSASGSNTWWVEGDGTTPCHKSGNPACDEQNQECDQNCEPS